MESKKFYFLIKKIKKKLRMLSSKSIMPLTASDLEVLKSVRIVTGHVMIDGGKQKNFNMPISLSFLENLEIIEGLLQIKKSKIYFFFNY